MSEGSEKDRPLIENRTDDREERTSAFNETIEQTIRGEDASSSESDTFKPNFRDEILVVDDADIHIQGIRRLLEEVFGIKKELIHGSETREKALEIAKNIKSRLLVFSDVFEHEDIPNTVDFINRLKKVKEDIYIALITGHIPRVIKQMPELNPVSGSMVRIIIDKFGKRTLTRDIKIALDDFEQIDDDSGRYSDFIKRVVDCTFVKEFFADNTAAGIISDVPAPIISSGRSAEKDNGNIALEPSIQSPFDGALDKIGDNKDVIGRPAQDDEVLAFVRGGRVTKGNNNVGNDSDTQVVIPEEAEPEKNTPPVKKLKSCPPENPLYSWDIAKFYLPEQQKARIIEDINRLESRKRQLSISDERHNIEIKLLDLKKRLKELGGDSKIRLKEILQRYEIEEHSAWHEKIFGAVEIDVFTDKAKTLTERFGTPIESLVVTDRGLGEGRSLKMWLDIIKNKKGEIAAYNAIRNLRGIDLMPFYIDKARKNLLIKIKDNYIKTKGSCPETILTNSEFLLKENLLVGDFSDHISKCDERFKSGKSHLNICMMRTCFHNVTEKDWDNFLTQIEKDLIPGTTERAGGIAIIDTVAMRRGTLNAMRDPEARARLDDLKNLYPSLWRKYCHDHQHIMPEDSDIDLTLMRRYPIYDNTTCQGFYWREIATVEFIKYVIEKNNLDLKVSVEAAFPTSPNIPVNESGENYFTNIGRDFIRNNELEEVYRDIIKKRIDDGIVNPMEILGEDFKGENVIEALLDYVAYHMVKGFGSEYIYLERPKSEN